MACICTRGPCSQCSQSNPLHPTLIFNNQTPTLVPFFVRRCASSSLASDHFFSSLLPARSPGRSPYTALWPPGCMQAGTCGQPPPSAPPSPYPVTFVAYLVAQARHLLGHVFSVTDFANSYLHNANISF